MSGFAPPKRSSWILPREFKPQASRENQLKTTPIFHIAIVSPSRSLPLLSTRCDGLSPVLQTRPQLQFTLTKRTVDLAQARGILSFPRQHRVLRDTVCCGQVPTVPQIASFDMRSQSPQVSARRKAEQLGQPRRSCRRLLRTHFHSPGTASRLEHVHVEHQHHVLQKPCWPYSGATVPQRIVAPP